MALQVSYSLTTLLCLHLTESSYKNNTLPPPLPLTANSDFELLDHIRFSNTARIVLLMVNDEVTLEYDDRVHLGFSPDNASLIRELEDRGEFIRSSAIVNIIDNDCKYLW